MILLKLEGYFEIIYFIHIWKYCFKVELIVKEIFKCIMMLNGTLFAGVFIQDRISATVCLRLAQDSMTQFNLRVTMA